MIPLHAKHQLASCPQLRFQNYQRQDFGCYVTNVAFSASADCLFFALFPFTLKSQLGKNTRRQWQARIRNTANAIRGSGAALPVPPLIRSLLWAQLQSIQRTARQWLPPKARPQPSANPHPSIISARHQYFSTFQSLSIHPSVHPSSHLSLAPPVLITAVLSQRRRRPTPILCEKKRGF